MDNSPEILIRNTNFYIDLRTNTLGEGITTPFLSAVMG